MAYLLRYFFAVDEFHNQNKSFFGNGNNTTTGLFGNNTNNNQIASNIFSNNNNTTGGLFGNSSNNTTGGLFGNNNNNNQGGGLFGNNNNNNLFGNANNANNNTNSIFGNNTNNNNNNTGGGLFGNNNNGNSLFGNNNNNSNLNTTNNTSIFGNNNNNQGGGLFGNNNNNANNNNQTGGLFGNNNSGGSLFGNNNNGNNNNTGGLFGNLNNNNNNNTNKGNSLFGNSPLFGNNANNNTGGGLFGNNNANNNNNNGNTSLFGQNNNNTGFSLFGNNNTNNNNNQSLFGNTANQGNNNMNNANMTNNGVNNNGLYSELSLNDIINPLEYLHSSKTIKLSKEDEILSNTITEAIQKQKSINQFLEDLDKKYSQINQEENYDILDDYGTYAASVPNNNYVLNEREAPTFYQNNNISGNLYKSYSNIKRRNMDLNRAYEESKNYYNEEELSNSMSKISNIYEEYERNKNKFKTNKYNTNKSAFFQPNKFSNNLNNSRSNLNLGNSLNKIRSNLLRNSHNNINNNTIIGRDNALYNQNMLELTKLNSRDLRSNKEFNKGYQNYNLNEESDESDDNDEILVMNNNNENDNGNNSNNENIKINGVTPQDINSPKTIDLIIKYRLPDSDSSGNMNILKIENVNTLIKIATLRNEIKSRISNELKLKELNDRYSIEKISLMVPGEFLMDTKSIQDYDLVNNDFTIQAFITYSSSISKKDKKINAINNNKNNRKIKDNDIVPFDLVPKLTKEGYKCNPSILELSRKTANELRNVSGFKIYNKYGEVEFKEQVNLLGLNLDNQITIEKNLIDTGDKLNYWSKFKLYNLKLEENGQIGRASCRERV